jgi:hypothetical protein
VVRAVGGAWGARKVEVIAPPFHHNPTLNKVPRGPYVIVSLGCSQVGGNVTTNCSSWLPSGGHWPPRPGLGSREHVGDPAIAGVITMFYSDSMKGPWRQHPKVILEPASMDRWDSFVTNPSLYHLRVVSIPAGILT